MKRLFSFLLFGMLFCSLEAQIIKLSDTAFNYSVTRQILVASGKAFLVEETAGLSFTTDFGKTWQQPAYGIDSFDNSINDLIVFKDTLLALLKNTYSSNNVLQSTDGGQSWYPRSRNGITGLPFNRQFEITGLGSTKSKIYLLIQLKNTQDTFALYYSSDGYHWSLGKYFTEFWFNDNCLLHIHDSLIFIFGYNSSNGRDTLFYTPNGTQFYGIPKQGFDEFWREGISSDRVSPLIYYAFNGSPYKYNLNTHQWINLRSSSWPTDLYIDKVDATKDVLLCYGFQMTTGFIISSYRSLDGGASWTKINGPSNLYLVFRKAAQINDTVIVANTQLQKIVYSYDKGLTWSKSLSYPFRSNIQTLAVNGKLLFMDNIHGIFRSTDTGQSWSMSNTGLSSTQPLTNLHFVRELFTDGQNLFLTMENEIDGDTHIVFRSTNYGTSWNRLTTIPPFERTHFAGRAGNTLFVRFNSKDNDNSNWEDQTCVFYYTKNGGNSWTSTSDYFYDVSKMNLRKVYGFCGSTGHYYLFARNRNDRYVIYHSTNGAFNSWIKIFESSYSQRFRTINQLDNPIELPVAEADSKGNLLFALQCDANDFTDSLYYFNGSNFQTVSLNGLSYPLKIFGIKNYRGYWYLTTSDGVFASRNLNKWHRLPGTSYPRGTHAYTIVPVGDQIFIGTEASGLYKFYHQILNIGNEIEVCEGDSVFLTATGTDSTVNWCCGYGSGKKIAFVATTSKNITASSKDIFGISYTDTVHLKVNEKPLASFIIPNNYQCFNGNLFNFTNTSNNAQISYWEFGDGTHSYTQNPSHSYTQMADTFQVVLIVKSDKGCYDTAYNHVYFKESPEARIYLAGDSIICSGDSTSIYANSGTGYTYQWYKDNKAIQGANNIFFVAGSSGSYSVKVTNSQNCSAQSKPQNITVMSSDFDVNFTASPRKPSYIPASQQFEAVAFTNLTPNLTKYNFMWIFGDGTTSTQSDPFHNYKYNGTYSVSLTAEHKQTGCRDTFTRENYILCEGGSQNPCPLSVTLSSQKSPVICRGDSILITAQTTGNIILYQWSVNGTIIPGADTSFIYAKESGEYHLIISDSNCSVSSLPFYVSFFPTVDPVIKSSGKIRPCSNDSIKLFLQTGYKSYLWSNNQTSPFIWVKQSGDYFVKVKDAFGCWIQSEPYTVNASLLEAPEICIVTVDTSTGKNLIAWERPQSNSILGYNVYKETSQANVYEKIAFVPYDSLSVYIDTASNPRKRANRYKISLVDTCMIESALSEHHKTIHLSANTGTSGENNLIWSHYEGFPFSSYKIYRGTTPYNLTLLDSVPSNLNSYSDLNPPGGLVFYQIAVVKNDTCYPAIIRTVTNSGPFSQSLSNLKDYIASTTDYLVLSQDTITFDSAGGTVKLDVFTTLNDWIVENNATWITVSSQFSNRKLIVSAEANTTGTSRQAVFTVKATGVDDVPVLVFQKGSTGIAEYRSGYLFVYPNPFDLSFIVRFKPGIYSRATLYDVCGKPVFSSSVSSKLNRIIIHRNQLANGVYFLHMTGKNIRHVVKVMAK